MLPRLAIQPMQQFANTTGKNATDSALIIDAMDLLYAGNLDAFALVSSDSDFTRLATRLRESGATVYGLGQRKTPEPFRCRLRPVHLPRGARRRRADPSPTSPTSTSPTCGTLMTKAVDSTSQDDGWASLSAVGQLPRTTPMPRSTRATTASRS